MLRSRATRGSGWLDPDRRADPQNGVSAARFSFRDGGHLELLAVDEPGDRSAPVADFLDRVGEGIYRVDLGVADLDEDGIDPATQTEDPFGRRRASLPLADGRAVGGARFDLVEDPAADAAPDPQTWWKRIFTTAVVVPAVDGAVAAFVGAGQELWDRSGREEWGLDTAVFRQVSGSNVEFVAPTDPTRSTGHAINRFMERTGGGHYMPVIEVDDIDEVYERLERDGVSTLGAPSMAPPESPWGPVRQMWVHPKLTHGAFVEFLSVES